MIKTLFFDFGNVIAHFDHWRAVRQFAKFTDMPEPEIYATCYDNPLEDAYERGAMTTAEYFAQAIEQTRSSLRSDEYYRYFIDIFEPNADVIDAIPELAKRYRIVLASNTNDAHFAHYTRQFAETFRHFAATPTSHQCGHRKPEAGYFEYCQRFADAEPGECLFIDDMPGNIEGGHRHGWQTLHYQPRCVLLTQLADAEASRDQL